MQGKKIKGRKRHIIVDTLGLLLTVLVHSAGIQDTNGAKQLVQKLYMKHIKLKKLFADGGSNINLLFYQRDGLLREHFPGYSETED